MTLAKSFMLLSPWHFLWPASKSLDLSKCRTTRGARPKMLRHPSCQVSDFSEKIVENLCHNLKVYVSNSHTLHPRSYTPCIYMIQTCFNTISSDFICVQLPFLDFICVQHRSAPGSHLLSNDSCQKQRVPLVQVSQWQSSSCSASRPSSCFTSNQTL